MGKCLVTGAAGFIGSAIVRELIREFGSARGLDDFSTGKPENIAELKGSLEFHPVSLLDSAGLAVACRGIDCIFHQAAVPSVPKSIAEPRLTNEVNIIGTLNLLLAARDAGVKRVVYAASSSVYGESQVLPKHEGMVPHPISPYAVQKLAGEHYMHAFAMVYGVETVSLRYFNVFGPRQDANSQYSGVLAKFITNMLAGRPSTIFGDGEQSRDFTFVENVVRANLLAAEAPAAEVSGKVFNVATGVRYSLNQTYKILQDIIGFAGAPQYAAPRVGDVKHSLADIGLAQKHLRYSPTVGFEEGLRRTVSWYRRASPEGAETTEKQLANSK